MRELNQDNHNHVLALQQARGAYQINLLFQLDTLGGSTLRGKAKNYRSRYRRSANNLLYRLTNAGVKYDIKTGTQGGLYSAVIVLH